MEIKSLFCCFLLFLVIFRSLQSKTITKMKFENYSWKALNRRKPIEDSLAQEISTLKHLKWWDLTAFGIATTIGSGIYVTCGLVARDLTGPSVVFSTLIAGTISILTGICYLEFASSLPISGSGYAYFYTLVGEFLAWFIGWNLTLEYAFSAAAISGGWTNYIVTLFESLNIPIPKFMYDIPLIGFLRLNFLSPLVVIFIGFFVSKGLKFGAILTNGITIFNLALIGFIIIVGGTHIKTSNWSPFAPTGVGAIFQGAGEMFFSYLGFDTITTLAADSVNPSRDIPMATILTITIATVLYMSVGLVLTGMQNFKDLDETNPLALAFTAVGCEWAYYIVTVCALTTMTLTIFTSMVGQPKIFKAMARDGLLPSKLALANRNHVPMYGVTLTIILTSLLALFLDVRTGLIDMISFGCLFCLSAICAATLTNRFTRLEEMDPNIPSISLKKIGIISVLIYYFGCLGTAAIWNRSSLSFLHLSITFFLFLTTILAPFLVLSYLFIKNGKLLGASSSSESNLKHFACPAMPILPCLAILFNSVVMMKTEFLDIVLFLIWSIIGISIYFIYGINNSKLIEYQELRNIPGEIEKVHELK